MNDSKKNSWKFEATIILLLVIFSIVIFLARHTIASLKAEAERSALIREVNAVDSLELLWSTSVRVDRTLHGRCDNSSTSWVFLQLDVQNQQLIFPALDQKIPFFNRVYLTGLDLESGQTNWRTLLDTTLYAIGGNSDRIIIVEENHTPPAASCSSDLDYCEAAKIVSYDILTGEMGWSKLQSNMRAAGRLCVNEEMISIIGAATRSTYHEEVSLVASTGEKIPFQNLRFDVTEEEVRINRQLIHELGIDESELRGGFVVEDKYLFVLTMNDNTLRIINRETLELVGKAEFDGEPLSAEANYYDQYNIVTDNDYVVVYLGDSQQLFTFRFVP
jgi:hypothetical protein